MAQVLAIGESPKGRGDVSFRGHNGYSCRGRKTLIPPPCPQAMIEMKNKETPFCESAQRTESYVTGEQKGVDDVIRSIIT